MSKIGEKRGRSPPAVEARPQIQEIKTGDLKISANVESKVKHMDEIGVFFFRDRKSVV